jgi:hypothetical protein
MGRRSAEVGLSIWNVLTSPKARKFQLALVGLLLSAATGGLLPPDVAVWVILSINTLTAYGVFQIPNKTSTPTTEVTEIRAMVRGDVVG